mmetsp:Transcript_36725/g.63078  ORF Transcript_36725/g.63078 Transcript_36725/m.63078 type:complete len:211 (-) Transcript_36725:512-1144(-)
MEAAGPPLPALRRLRHGHHVLVPPAAGASLVQVAQVARVLRVLLRHDGHAGRPHRVGFRPPLPPPAHGDAARPALIVRRLLLVAPRLDARCGDLRGPLQRPQQRRRPREAARLPPFPGLVHAAHIAALCALLRHRRSPRALLASIRHGLPLPRHMVRQLGRAHVGHAGLRDGRPVAQQLVGWLVGLWRGLAQQPPRLRILGAPRPPAEAV